MIGNGVTLADENGIHCSDPIVGKVVHRKQKTYVAI